MNYRVLSKILGLLLLLLGGAMVLCAGYGHLTGEPREGFDPVDAFGVAIAVTMGAGLLMVVAGRGSGRTVLRKEGIAIVGLGWLLCGGAGALPYVLCEPGMALPDALFESFSGFTTTGASVIADLDRLPRSLLLWRATTQWLGGGGILVLFVALLSSLGVGSKVLFTHESSAKSGDGLEARIRNIAITFWGIYAILTVVCCLGLMVLGMSAYDAVCHSFTVMPTGGFSPQNRSIAAYDSLGIELWLVLFMILGSMSFFLYAWMLKGRWERWEREEEAKYFLIIIVLATLLIALDLLALGHASVGRAFRDALFQVAAILTTTGYATADYDQWPHFSRFILLMLMAMGGCAGSTAGGIKVSRCVLFLKMVRQQVVNAFRPNQIVAVKLNGNTADDHLRLQTAFFIALAAMVFFGGAGVVALLEPLMDIDSSLSAVITCFSNVGPGLGMVGPAQNFAFLGPATKLFLCLVMILGRLEFFAVLVLFMPSLWRKY